MDDDFDIKPAFRNYLSTHEPPFPLTSEALLARGQRDRQWRMGVSAGSGVAAAALTAALVMTLAPGGGAPVLDTQSCDVQLPIADFPDLPSRDYRDLSPRPDGSSIVIQLSDEPTQEPTYHPSQDPTDLPSADPSRPATGPVPGDVDQARLDTMACYLKREAMELFPAAGFAPPSLPPMTVERMVEKMTDGRWDPINGRWEASYRAAAFVIQDDQTAMIDIKVQSRPANLVKYADEEVRTTNEGYTVYIGQPYDGPFGGPGFNIRLATQHSLIYVRAPQMMTVEQAIELASGPELDLYRPSGG